jgi:hypothetical protein
MVVRSGANGWSETTAWHSFALLLCTEQGEPTIRNEDFELDKRYEIGVYSIIVAHLFFSLSTLPKNSSTSFHFQHPN